MEPFKNCEVIANAEASAVDDLSTTVSIGTTSAIKRVIRRTRRKITGEMTIRKVSEDLVISPKLLLPDKGENFLYLTEISLTHYHNISPSVRIVHLHSLK